MNVSSYTFQSPYPNQVQVGRPDPSTSKADTTNAAEQGSSELIKSTNTSVSDAESFQATQTNEVKPTVDSGNSLDIYA